ncbi:MAG TPA: 23S rRNA pseudouridine(2605) synthase RluB [Gammaproteobacteria bacterium]|nr:23S rRNA pseudouridine(2605) synthase RluB [Gammaproteobacteria bacterium]
MSSLSPGPERIQKVLAALGLGSRREIETWIAAGRVSVNGRPAKLGDRIGAADRVQLDGKPVKARERAGETRRRVILYHKPEGELTTREDPEGRPTVFEALPRLRGSRWVSVGRLDTNTSGLLIFTNDGELANRLMHPSAGLEQEFAVRVLGAVTEEQLAQLTRGVKLEKGMGRFDTVREAGGEGANRWYHVTLKEGRNKDIRALWEALGANVSRLIRVRYGSLNLPRHLPRGVWREATDEETALLLAAVHMPAEEPKVPVQRKTLRLSKTRRKPRPR